MAETLVLHGFARKFTKIGYPWIQKGHKIGFEDLQR